LVQVIVGFKGLFDRHRLRIQCMDDGNVKVGVIDVEFESGPEYAVLANAAATLIPARLCTSWAGREGPPVSGKRRLPISMRR
jgi:hypothetical protein